MTEVQESKETQIELVSKKVWGKKMKSVQNKKLIDNPYESNIRTVVGEHVS